MKTLAEEHHSDVARHRHQRPGGAQSNQANMDHGVDEMESRVREFERSLSHSPYERDPAIILKLQRDSQADAVSS